MTTAPGSAASKTGVGTESRFPHPGAPTLKARRTLAIALAPFIAETISLMRQRDTAGALHEHHVALRADRVFMLVMLRFGEPCKWTKEQVWHHLDATGNDTPDAS